MSSMDRRQFLRAAGLAGVAMVGGPGLLACSGASSSAKAPSARNVPRAPLPPDSVLAHSAKECPIDTVVVLTMENRSFDHYLGWLATDEQYLQDGRRRHGKDFHVNGRLHERYRNPFGAEVPTRHTLSLAEDSSPYRGCDHLGPGHSWEAGRVQRDFGFLAAGSHNDSFAASYYLDTDVPRARADGPAVHSDGPTSRVARPDIPEPHVPLFRTVGRAHHEPGTGRARDVQRADDFRRSCPSGRRDRRVLRRPSDRAALGTQYVPVRPTRRRVLR